MGRGILLVVKKRWISQMERSKERRWIDMLNRPIWNKLPRFALPVAATAILEQLFTACDVAVVGNFTGKPSLLPPSAQTALL